MDIPLPNDVRRYILCSISGNLNTFILYPQVLIYNSNLLRQRNIWLSIMTMIHHRWENFEKRRYYRVIFTRDLFGDWVITKIWGGLNKSGGGSKHLACTNYEEGIKIIEKITQMRIKRGYHLIPASYESKP